MLNHINLALVTKSFFKNRVRISSTIAVGSYENFQGLIQHTQLSDDLKITEV